MDSKIYFDKEQVQVKKILKEFNFPIYATMFIYPKDKNIEGSYLSLYDNDYPYSEEYNIALNNNNGMNFIYNDEKTDELIYAFAKYYEPYRWIVTVTIPEKDIDNNYNILHIKQERDLYHLIFFLILFCVVLIVSSIFIMNKNYMKTGVYRF